MKSKVITSKSVSFVTNASKSDSMVKFVKENPISHIGIEVISIYDLPKLKVKKNKILDIHSIHPLVMVLVSLEERNNDKEKYTYSRFIIDLQQPDITASLEPLFLQSICFVGHRLKSVFWALWKLDLPTPRIVWDTSIAESALTLGVFGKGRLGINSLCNRYKIIITNEVKHSAAWDMIINNLGIKSLDQDVVKHRTKIPEACALIYHQQIYRAKILDVLPHLKSIEMPVAPIIAKLEWKGVRISEQQHQKISGKCDKRLNVLEKKLLKYGINNPRSPKQLKRFFRNNNLLSRFKTNGKYSFAKDLLKSHQKEHKAIPVILEAKRLKKIKTEVDLLLPYKASDGRIHPQYSQIGTLTGRIMSKNPSIMHLHGYLRPVVVPGKDRGIGEVDLSQIEVGIAGAIYRESQLIKMFNTGDVYTAMAKHFYRHKLSKNDRKLSDKKFKEKHQDYRDRMKVCTLGIIYGMTPSGIAKELKCTLKEAQDLYAKFMKMFPQLGQNIAKRVKTAGSRGYSLTVTDLPLYSSKKGVLSPEEIRQFANHPVQGSAAAIFKHTLVRIEKRYQEYDAEILIPLHDAVVFEAPLSSIRKVAKLTRRVLCESVKKFFPELNPKATINIDDKGCWKRKGLFKTS